jgi:ATP-dependent Clp protease protease subunit
MVRGEAEPSEAEILLYDEIGWWGVTAEEFRRELDGLSAETIHLRINSPGGNVFDGVAMYNALREHPARIVTHIDGLAASMASMVALAGDEVHMTGNAFFMIHDPWTISIGNAAELRKDADVLEKVGGSLEDTYRHKTGATTEQVRAWMEAETWFTADEASEAGFVDVVVTEEETDEALAAAAAAYDLSVFAHTPDVLAAPPSAASGEEPVPDLADLRAGEDRAVASVLRLRLDMAERV